MASEKAQATKGIYGREVEQRWLHSQARALVSDLSGSVLLLGAQPGLGRRQLLNWFTAALKRAAPVQVVSIAELRHAGDPFSGLRLLLEALLGGSLIRRTSIRSSSKGLINGGAQPRTPEFLRGLSQSSLRYLVSSLFTDAASASEGKSLVRIEGAAKDSVRTLRNLIALSSLQRPVVLVVGALERLDPSWRDWWCSSPRGSSGTGIIGAAPDILDRRLNRCPPAPLLERVRQVAPGRQEKTLGPLADDAMMELVSQKGAFDAAVMEAVLKRTEGNPYFVEELVRLLIDLGELEESKKWGLLQMQSQGDGRRH